jgi:hypothetical protein
LVYKLFVSHSSLDTTLVELVRSLKLPGIELYFAEDDPRYGDPLPAKIEHEIDTSDALVVFLTKHGAESASVNQEVGYARKAHKRIIAVVEDGTKVGVLIQGVEIIRFSKDRIEDAIKLFVHYVMPKAKEKNGIRLLGIGLLVVIAVVAIVAIVIWKIPSVFSRRRSPPAPATTD